MKVSLCLFLAASALASIDVTDTDVWAKEQFQEFVHKHNKVGEIFH